MVDKNAETFGLEVLPAKVQGGAGILNVRRLNQLGTFDSAALTFTPNPLADVSADSTAILCVVSGNYAVAEASMEGTHSGLSASFVVSEQLIAAGGTGGTLTIPSFESDFATDPSPVIPEIDIKIESLAVTATTRKLRARWSPELAQDLNAYHSLDAEVELTQILSEQIALEIDRS